MTTTASSESKQQSASDKKQCGAGALAGLASFFLPGLGHFLAKSPLRGLLFFALWGGAFALCFKALFSYDLIAKLPLLLAVTIALMLISAIDAFIVGRKKGLIAGGCVLTYATITFVATIGIFAWAIFDAMKSGGKNLSFAEAAGTVSGMYAIGVASLGVLVLLIAALGRNSAALSGVARVGIGLLIAALLFWPHDKLVQKTILGMIKDKSIIIVSDDSMSPNITAGDWVVVHKDAPIERFNSVLFAIPAEEKTEGDNRKLWKIKRVYGLPGEEVEIVAATLMINHEPVALPSIAPQLTWTPNPMRLFAIGEAGHSITLRNDEYYVLGDNLDGAYDSRYAYAIPDTGHHQQGAFPKSVVAGRASFIIFPFSRMGATK